METASRRSSSCFSALGLFFAFLPRVEKTGVEKDEEGVDKAEDEVHNHSNHNKTCDHSPRRLTVTRHSAYTSSAVRRHPRREIPQKRPPLKGRFVYYVDSGKSLQERLAAPWWTPCVYCSFRPRAEIKKGGVAFLCVVCSGVAGFLRILWSTSLGELRVRLEIVCYFQRRHKSELVRKPECFDEPPCEGTS